MREGVVLSETLSVGEERERVCVRVRVILSESERPCEREKIECRCERERFCLRERTRERERHCENQPVKVCAKHTVRDAAIELKTERDHSTRPKLNSAESRKTNWGRTCRGVAF